MNLLEIGLGALGGACAGSFIAALVQRWGEGRPITGRSHCDACKVQLCAIDLVPLLSWLMLRGRCRLCGVSIGKRLVLVELVCALIGGAALWLVPGVSGVLGALLGWQLLALALFDADHMRLPHGMTATLAATGLVAGLWGVEPDIVNRLLGGMSGFAALFLLAKLYRAARGHDGLGGGDPPMLGAIGCWLGWQALPLVMVGAGLAGLALVVTYMVSGKALSRKSAVPLGSLMAGPAFLLWCLSLP